MKHIIGFREESTRLKTLNRKEWDFDRRLLGSLTEEDWLKGIKNFQAKLTDDVLLAASRRLPREVYVTYGKGLYDQLRKRRDSMPNEVMKYYRFLKDRPVNPLKEELVKEKA